MTYAITDSWQISASLPLQFRKVSISYQLTDGTEYDPPYAGIHHRNETLWGIGDPQLTINKIFWWKSWGIMPSLSTSIPLGKTEENPYLRAQESLVHQHIQMGTGSFVPSMSLTLFRDEIHWGMLHSVQHSQPMYENSYNYKPGANTRWSIGYWRRITTKLIIMPQVRGTHEAPERWMDIPYAGQDTIGINLSLFYRIQTDWEIGLQLDRNLWIQSRTKEEDPLNPVLLWNLSLTK